MKDPFVSVVMCTYNGEKYLDEQILSILEQTHTNLELIIVDDVSIDNSVALLNKWMEKDKRISLYQNEKNLGYNKNFEKAITLARGDYIALSDQDDVWLPHKIERLLGLFVNDDVVLVHSRSVQLINGKLSYPKGKLLFPFTGNDPKKLIYDNQIGGHKIIFRKFLVKKIIPVPPTMFYDWWIGVVAACNGFINATDEYLVKYRIHDANSHANVKKEIRNKHIDHLTAWYYFGQIKEMKTADKIFISNLIQLVKQHKNAKKIFDYKLFLFLLKNKGIMFANRRRLVKDFLNLKFIIYYAITKF